ncbi:MAG: DNA polymerase III subunit beta [Thermodesulfobacteriota bacterium]|nr:DNA polymerase III subunit beta [Thermodesulfobacteriota bacterium]
MKFLCDKTNISAVLSQIQGITGRKTNLAITSDVLIKAEGSKIFITANDLETVFSGKYEAKIESDGIISINSQKLYEIVREYPDTQIPLNEIENRWVEIGEGNIQYHIVSSKYENFPETPLIEDISFIEIASISLKKMVNVSSLISFGREEKRIYVLGALLEKISDEEGERLRMVSTDSKRLNCFEAEYKGEFQPPEENIIIPKKGLSEIGKFLGKEEYVKIGIKDNHFIVKKDDETIMIKLLEGDYPDYRRVINTEKMTSFEIDKSMFLMVMRRMSILSSDDYKSVMLDFKENELSVTITNPDLGESREDIMINYSGNKFESAFNPKYFIDALNAMEEDTVVVSIKDNKNPCIIKGINDDKLICSIMAMSV